MLRHLPDLFCVMTFSKRYTMANSAITLDDKYTQIGGRVFMSSNQALVRLPLDQARRDKVDGLRTAGYISGYRGSPIGVYDTALWGAQKLLDDHNIRFQPGLNEELAVSANRGAQELAWFGKSDFKGVFTVWYGKGIGVDRACESLKLGNFEGASATGGFLAIAGDDHGGKSSDSAHQSEHTLIAAMLPVLYPSTIAEIIEFGLFGWQLSRFSGCYVALKCITDTLDITGAIELPDPFRTYIKPAIDMPLGGLNLRPNQPPLVEEDFLVNHRLPAAQAFANANAIDRTILDGNNKTLAIVSAGKAYLDVRQALFDLGLDETACARLGIRLYKPGMIWPLEKENLVRFAGGSKAVLVVEEKRPVMEDQIARHLYTVAADARPAIAGKSDLKSAPLLPSTGELAVPQVRRAIKTILSQLGIEDKSIAAQYEAFSAIETQALQVGSSVARPAFFCSGCPHNTSTNLPDGSMAMGGIGCHGLVAVVMDRNTMQFMPMGHEGSPWVSVGPLVDTEHMFTNMGDGTYSHSGVLAIRAAVAAKANITYKLLYNDAVAMTGGQPVEQSISPTDMVDQLLSEGVDDVRLVTDNPAFYKSWAQPAKARLHHRDDLDSVQKELRDIPGVTAIVYEQTCATEKRRRRKRGLMDDPDKRVFINPDVCEGCGDCSVQSNCISVEPLETEFGRKRKINQSTCNKDFSCVKGMCPSFVTVEGAQITVKSSGDEAVLDALIASLPDPVTFPIDQGGYNILVGGIGGTGVLTIGALLGMAAHIDGKGSTILDMTGMAQKGGAVTSHIRIAPSPADIYTSRLSEGMTDLILACDMIVGSGQTVLKTVKPGQTTIILNDDIAPTGDFQANNKTELPAESMKAAIEKAVGSGVIHELHASKLSTELTGDSIGTNVFMMGYAAQKGLLPLPVSAIEEAIRLNGTFVKGNLRTFALGRLAAHDPDALAQAITSTEETVALDTLDDILRSRTKLLTNYQNTDYAKSYTDFITSIRNNIQALNIEGGEAYTKAVALTLARIMAYKDEYEVARLYSDPAFKKRLTDQFSGNFKMRVHVVPPAMRQNDASGRPKKRAFSGAFVFPVFSMLAKLKGLRGTPFDILGYTHERKEERKLIEDYKALIEHITPDLTQAKLSAAITLAEAAADVKGYGPVKEANLETYKANLPSLLEAFKQA